MRNAQMTPAALREKPILAWHFVAIRDGVPTLQSYDKTTDRDALVVAPGYIYTTDEPKIGCCASGLHWSRDVRDALSYAPQAERLAVCRVLAWGEVDERADKGASRHREVLWVADATDALRWWALDCAWRVEQYAKDPRVAACNQASEDYLRGQIMRDELWRARDAADAAAERKWQSDALTRRMLALGPRGAK